MINEMTYDALMTESESMKWRSMMYLDYEEIAEADLIASTPDLILLLNAQQTPAEIHFASNSLELLSRELQDRKLHGKLKFIPATDVPIFEAIGFKVDCAFSDFVNPAICNTVLSNTSHVPFEFAEASDIPNLVALSQACKGMSRGFNGETETWFQEWLTENSILLKRDNNNITGFCCVSIYNEGTTLWIRELAVLPEMQGRGIGRALLTQALQYGISENAVKAFLAVDIENHNAIHLYKNMGFIQKENEIEIQMSKPADMDV